MSVTARRLARLSTGLATTVTQRTTPAASCRLLRTSSSIVPSARTCKIATLETSSIVARRRGYASSAAAVKEAEEDAEPPKWPERVLPEITAKDVKRLSRQRNIGM